MKTLEQIIKEERVLRHEEGIFGIKACKESIKEDANGHGGIVKPVSYFEQLERYLERANNDIFFNKAMVLACWELINGIE